MVNITIEENNEPVTITIVEDTETVTINVIENASVSVTYEGAANSDRVLVADGPTEDGDGNPTYNPASGQSVIYLPSATQRYRLFGTSGPLLEGIHYERTGNQINLLTGDISEDDNFLLCEY